MKKEHCCSFISSFTVSLIFNGILLYLQMNSEFMILILHLLGQNEHLGIVVEGRLEYIL